MNEEPKPITKSIIAQMIVGCIIAAGLIVCT